MGKILKKIFFFLVFITSMARTKQTARVGRKIKEVGEKPLTGSITKERIVKPPLKPKKPEVDPIKESEEITVTQTMLTRLPFNCLLGPVVMNNGYEQNNKSSFNENSTQLESID